MRRVATLLLVLATALTVSCQTRQERTRVVLLGFDGANWETIDPLIEAGRLPYLKQLRRQSAWGRLKTFKPTKSPVIWTSIATGKTMLKHGIVDFAFVRKNEIQVPYSVRERRTPAVWEILHHFHRRSVVVNWWATHPPDTIEGVMVSSRFKRVILRKDKSVHELRDCVHPLVLFEPLVRLARWDYNRLRAEKDLPDLTALYGHLHPDRRPRDVPVLGLLPTYVLQEAFVESVSQHLYRTEDFDLFAAYFRLPDLVQHCALSLMDPRDGAMLRSRLRTNTLSEDDRRVYRRKVAAVLEPFYRYMEGVIRSFVSAEGHENTYFIIVSDHGFDFCPRGYDHYNLPANVPAPSGIFLMKGPGTRRGRVTSVSVFDVTPTLLYLLDLPIGQDMDGAPAMEGLHLSRQPRFQPYGADLMTRKREARDEVIDRQALEELKAVGYVE